jgi:CHAT domain-containing protein
LEKPIKERIIDMDSLRFVMERQELELARDSKAYGDFARNLRINWKDVQQKLGSNDIAIEFLDFPLYGTDSTMYVALTLKQGYKNPHLTSLFEKQQLKSIPEENYYTNSDLYNLIWKPLDTELSGVKNIYFSPSGDLHRIGIEYVPVTMTDNMCDKYNIHRLSSTRQLAYIQDETKGDKSVLYGGLKYEVAVSDTIPAPPSSKVNRGFTFVPRAIVDSLDIRGSYKYLPGTKEEADRIASNLDSYSIPYKYYYGTRGTEESFKSLDGSKPKTLHIATHGFYMTEQDAEKKNFARPLLLEESRGCREDKPMTRSGLLLSGCSRALNHESIPEGVEDGILTADEISKLDMRGLDLVVLSACQTGLGDITSGEGVFGLQRGFKNAGAKTIIMSLWNVSDIATQHLMTSFYNHYLSGMPKEQAFRMAQAELRKLIDPGQSKPDWAAFVMLDGL